MRSDAERERLRETFDQAAEIYHRVRPDYPEALFDDLIALAGLAPGDRLLEVGCATGKATLPLARRGFRVTCVELGSELAAVARRNLTAVRGDPPAAGAAAGPVGAAGMGDGAARGTTAGAAEAIGVAAGAGVRRPGRPG